MAEREPAIIADHGRCVGVLPARGVPDHALRVRDKIVQTKQDRCLKCGACIFACKHGLCARTPRPRGPGAVQDTSGASLAGALGQFGGRASARSCALFAPWVSTWPATSRGSAWGHRQRCLSDDCRGPCHRISMTVPRWSA